MRCEDYPCCGHTPLDPCTREWYDEPGAFDTSRPGNEHALCDHENGDCDVRDDEDPDWCDDHDGPTADCYTNGEHLADYDMGGEDAFLDSYWEGE